MKRFQKSALWSSVGGGDASKMGPAGAQGGAPSVSGAAGGLLPGQTAPQGIFHSWVSMVAEQMGHHEVHYPWVNGEMKMGADVNGGGVNKAHNPLDENNPYLYGARANGTSPGSPPVVTSSGHAGNMLVVPQPSLLTSKLPTGHPTMPSGYLPAGAPVGATNNTGRKYQCKMCPQVTVREGCGSHQEPAAAPRRRLRQPSTSPTARISQLTELAEP
ncbi:hypothetical protein FJT64_016907 [Amphibalanus amphitrite]|uniref:Uncharacterized protein n=1 Tax=Amphibalanus amphitrite TaxID=1232801 RepID=A0A6A4XDA7_AMPAM|nr:hypothetical protein FJT64_016907 [Amphibalanus amphitrite]